MYGRVSLPRETAKFFASHVSVPVAKKVPITDIVMASPTDEEVRDRIVRHMNQAHTRELSHLVRHFAATTTSEAKDPSLRDLTLQGMRVRAGGNDFAIPFSPALGDWSEARARIIAMDDTARRSLGISDIYITQYAPPRGFDRVIVAFVFFYVACVATLPYVVPGSASWAVVNTIFPGGAATYTWLVRFIRLPVFAVHALETAYLDRRLRRHGVDRWSGLWWMWALDCFVEGFFAIRRFDAVVAEKRASKEAKKS
ncbi:hypothetical protein L249_7171 [Ophiocordyceps polyrhachis-furcata BCC 54312]|uniref:DUF2470 domain-containing protein n=1 Tax=Ophiocordyceps polyrhachis-furcata BCC 54312 TaxID=1330021 RepID=A0A367LBA1_9HYPO|nr:hypothetical protein L249_7171 [Ophiocordyceps polyrhachis-furcata BCC 54312]